MVYIILALTHCTLCLLHRCASPRSAPQQAAAWAAQLGGCGACAYQALQLQRLLRLSTAQEQVAVLQWLMACAAQWMVLEPALALLLSLTRSISTRLCSSRRNRMSWPRSSKAAVLPRASPLAALGSGA